MTKPKIEREISVSDDKKVVQTLSHITERFTMEQFKEVIKGKEASLEKLRAQSIMIKSQMSDKQFAKESSLLQKARRLFGAKLGELVSEFMNVETYKRSGEILKGIEQDIEIVENDVREFKAILGEKPIKDFDAPVDTKTITGKIIKEK